MIRRVCRIYMSKRFIVEEHENKKKKKLFSLGTYVVLFLSAAGRILCVCMYMYSVLAGTYRTVCIHMWINHRASPPYIYYTRVWSGRLCDDGSKIRM